MAFREVEFPRGISAGSGGGPGFQTEIVQVRSGRREKNQRWSEPLRGYDVAHMGKTQAQVDGVADFFYAVAEGRDNEFRYWDPSDYLVTSANGRLAATGQTGAFT